MKNNFYKCSLKDIAADEKGSIISGPFGSNISSKFFQESGVPVIRGNNLSNSRVKFIDNGFAYLSEEKADELNAYAIKDDLLFTAAGTIGQVGIIEKDAKFEKYVISNKQLRVRLNFEKVNPLYAYYWFSSPWMVRDIVNKNTGSTVPLINLGIIKTLEINIPKERIIQDKITAILSALDSKIELNNRINTELEAMAKTLYDYWFVQFDFPDANGKPYKTSGGKMVYNAALKREIPEGWDVSELRNLVDVVKGNISPVDILPTTPYVGLEHIGRKTIVLSDWTTSDIASSDKTVFKKHDILFGKIRPYFHKVAVALFDGITSTDTIILRPMKIEYFGLALETVFTEKFVNTATSSSTGSKMPRADWNVLQYYKIPVPDLPLLQSYQELFDTVLAKIEISVIESRKLTLLRDWLLPMLMNGQVVVANKVEI